VQTFGTPSLKSRPRPRGSVRSSVDSPIIFPSAHSRHSHASPRRAARRKSLAGRRFQLFRVFRYFVVDFRPRAVIGYACSYIRMLPACRLEKTTNTENRMPNQIRSPKSEPPRPLRLCVRPPHPLQLLRGVRVFCSPPCRVIPLSAFRIQPLPTRLQIVTKSYVCKTNSCLARCPPTGPTKQNGTTWNVFDFFSRRRQPAADATARNAVQCAAENLARPEGPASGERDREIRNLESAIARPAGRPGTRDQPSVGARRGHPADGFAGCRVAGARGPTASPMRSRRRMPRCRGGCCGGCSRLPVRPTAAGRAARAAGPARGACPP